MQRQYDKFQELDTEIIAVFREENEGATGLEKARKKTKATFPFVMDLGAEHTVAYSVDGFSTYLVSEDGTVKAELTGTKMIRPSVEDILAKVKEAVAP